MCCVLRYTYIKYNNNNSNNNNNNNNREKKEEKSIPMRYTIYAAC